MYYQIDAIDSWFFRDAAPFDAGGVNNYAESIFPPFPYVYAGALRNCAVPIENPDCNKNTFSRRLRIGWNGVIADNHIMFPIPLDLYIEENDGRFIAHELGLSSAAGSSFPLTYFLKSPQKNKKPPHVNGGAYINEKVMRDYLYAETSDFSVCPLGDYIIKENRIGNGIDDNKRMAATGKLYQQTLIIPSNEEHRCSLALEASGIKSPEKSIIHIGGDGKLGIVTRIEKELPIPEPPNIDSDCFKLYLATPAIFEKGWLPGWINSETMTGTFTHDKHSVRVKLFSAAVGRPVAVGGFTCKKNEKSSEKLHDGKDYKLKPTPKEMRYAVPAGSVYYFKLLDGNMKDVIRLFHKKCISEYRESLGFEHWKISRLRYCSRGFGYCLVGAISKHKRGEIHDV